MLGWLRRSADNRRIGHQLYERIVAQARCESFYREGGVPDTMEGRFEMIALHLVLVLQRLKPDGTAGQWLGQRLIEHLVADMDDALRQVGIGDMGVPRRVKQAAAAFAERSRDYAAALARETKGGPAVADALETALLANVFGAGGMVATAASLPHVVRLAGYVRAAARLLAATATEKVLAGHLVFPDPAPARQQ